MNTQTRQTVRPPRPVRTVDEIQAEFDAAMADFDDALESLGRLLEDWGKQAESLLRTADADHKPDPDFEGRNENTNAKVPASRE